MQHATFLREGVDLAGKKTLKLEITINILLIIIESSSPKSLVGRLMPVYAKKVAKKEATGFGDPNKVRRTSAVWRLFFVRLPLLAPFNERASVGIPSGMPDASFSRSPNSPCARSPRLATECGFSTLKEGTMPSTNTSKYSPAPSLAHTLSVDQLYQTAFYYGRTSRSQE
ncbi:MAG: hypothetical protein RR365_07180 [Bacteroides sp.]